MHVQNTEFVFKQVEITVDDYYLCDKCNSKIQKDNMYDAFEFELVHITGNQYPEGGSGDEQTLNLCQKCSVELITSLRSNGYRINDKEWNC